MNDRPISKVLEALHRVTGQYPKRCGEGWIGLCPVHDDHNPSLSISEGEDHRVLLHCHAGCTVDEVRSKAGLTPPDLFPSPGTSNHARGRRKAEVRHRRTVYPTPEDAAKAALWSVHQGQGRHDWWLVKTYPYHNSEGHEVAQVLRIESRSGDGKVFRPIHLNGTAWSVGDPPGRWPLYRLADLAGAKRFYVCEGEKDVDAARAIGLVATTSAHGANSTAKTDWSPLAGIETVFLPDNDTSGREYADRAAAILLKQGADPVVKVVELPGLGPGGDVHDFVAKRRADGRTDAEIQGEITKLADDAIQIRVPPIEGGLAGIEFCPIPASELGSGDQVEWVWDGWLARKYITELVGIWKGGKSTLLAHLLKATDAGGDIAGRIHPSKCLVVAEEGAGLWARRRDDIGVADNVHFLIRPFKGRPRWDDWEAFVQATAERVQAGDYNVVAIDTWQTISPCHDENDAAAMMRALTPLHRITEAGAAVLLIHHPRKGDANEGQASRGSGALPAFVDIIAELRRFGPDDAEDRRRKLRGLSRFDETPDEVVLELQEDGYVLIGSTTEAKKEDRSGVIQDLLAEGTAPVTVEEIRESWPDDGVPKPGIRTLRDDLKAGHAEGKWNRGGGGKKNDPYRYRKFDSGKPQPLVPESNRNEADTAVDSVPEPGAEASAPSSDHSPPKTTDTPEERRMPGQDAHHGNEGADGEWEEV